MILAQGLLGLHQALPRHPRPSAQMAGTPAHETCGAPTEPTTAGVDMAEACHQDRYKDWTPVKVPAVYPSRQRHSPAVLHQQDGIQISLWRSERMPAEYRFKLRPWSFLQSAMQRPGWHLKSFHG